MSTIFEDVKQGLEEAIAYEKGEGEAKVKTYTIMPIKEYSPKEIRKIRMDSGMTQKIFASYMGVSPKTVEAWERGSTHPAGPAFRLMEFLSSREIKDLEYVLRS